MNPNMNRLGTIALALMLAGAPDQLGRLIGESPEVETVAVVPHRLADSRPIAAAPAVDQFE